MEEEGRGRRGNVRGGGADGIEVWMKGGGSWEGGKGRVWRGKYGIWMGEAEGWDCCMVGRWVEGGSMEEEDGGKEGKCGEEWRGEMRERRRG